MQETRNNCFGSKKRNTTLRQAKSCYCISALVLTCFRLTKGRAKLLTRNNFCEFLASYGVTFQSVIKSFLKTPVFSAPLTYAIILPKIGKVCDFFLDFLEIGTFRVVDNFWMRDFFPRNVCYFFDEYQAKLAIFVTNYWVMIFF